MLKAFRCLKKTFKANTTIQGNAFAIDLFIISLGLKIYGEFERPKLLGCYGPGIWNIEQKDNGIDRNTLQCCHSQHKRS